MDCRTEIVTNLYEGMKNNFWTWKNHKNGSIQYEIVTLEEVNVYDKFVYLSCDSISAYVDKSLFKNKYPKKGDIAELYGTNRIDGLCINGETIFFKGLLEKEKERLREIEKINREKIMTYKKNKSRLDMMYASLPEIFKKRINLFRENGENWRIEWEGYEMAACIEAVNMAKHFRTKEKIEQFMKDGSNYIPLDEGHSGNTWSAAQRLAYYYITNPINVYMEHGVGTPLVGCEDYGCIHPRPQLSSNPTPQKEEKK